MIFDPICNFLTIDFIENLQECFFVRNQFLVIKNEGKNSKITRYLWKFPRTSRIMRFSKWLASAILKKNIFFLSFFMITSWFWTKKYLCKFSKKSIVKKLQIGSTIIILMGMKIIHICNFLTMEFYENLHEYFFVQNHFVILKNEKKLKKTFKMADGSHLENRMIPRVLGIFQKYRVVLEFFP